MPALKQAVLLLREAAYAVCHGTWVDREKTRENGSDSPEVGMPALKQAALLWREIALHCTALSAIAHMMINK